jgi:hypothetical protein
MGSTTSVVVMPAMEVLGLYRELLGFYRAEAAHYKSCLLYTSDAADDM